MRKACSTNRIVALRWLVIPETAHGMTVSVCGIIVLLVTALLVTGVRAAKPPVAVKSIQARLFYDKKGTFSTDVLSDPNVVLWNVVIGEGSAEKSSSQSTLVLVELSGAVGSFEPNQWVFFTAHYKRSSLGPKGTQAKNVAVSLKAPVGAFGADGRSYVGFWLYDTGCNPVRLSARIEGQPESSKVQAMIPFKCGE